MAGVTAGTYNKRMGERTPSRENKRKAFAERILTSVSDPKKSITVKLWLPRRTKHGDYECDFELVGPGIEIRRFAAGLDKIQALQLVMKMIGVHLSRIENRWGDKLQYQEGEWGFPKPSP